MRHQGLCYHVFKKPGNYCIELQVAYGVSAPSTPQGFAEDRTSMSASSEHTGNVHQLYTR